MRFPALLALLSAWLALPAAAQEARCTALGADCYASEPLNNSDTISSQTSWDPSDSTTKEWPLAGGSIMSTDAPVSQLTMVDSTMVGPNYAAGASSLKVWRVGYATSNTVVMPNFTCPPPYVQCAVRWYMRADYERPPLSQATGNQTAGLGDCYNRWKLLDASIVPGTAEIQPQVTNTENSSYPCPSYLTGGWSRAYIGRPQAQYLVPDFRPGEQCRKDSSGNNGWCGLEFTIWNKNGSDVEFTFKMWGIDNAYEAEATQTWAGHQVDEFTDIHINNFVESYRGYIDPTFYFLPVDGAGGYELSHIMHAQWESVSATRIGVASEIEGAGGTPAPVPSTAVILISGGLQ